MKGIVAYIFGLGLMVNAGLFIPQAIKIIKTKSAKEVSLITFAGFNIFQITGILHGIYQNDPYLLTGMIASFLACGAVTGSAIVYRNK